MIRAGHIELFVKDPAASREFYEKVLGATVADVQNGEFVWLALGGLVLLLRPGPRRHPVRPIRRGRVVWSSTRTTWRRRGRSCRGGVWNFAAPMGRTGA